MVCQNVFGPSEIRNAIWWIDILRVDWAQTFLNTALSGEKNEKCFNMGEVFFFSATVSCFLPTKHKTAIFFFTILPFSHPLRIPAPNRSCFLPCLPSLLRSLSREIQTIKKKKWTTWLTFFTNKSRGLGAVQIVPLHHPGTYIQNIHFPTVLLLAIIVGLPRIPVPECQSGSIDPDPNRVIEGSSL